MVSQARGETLTAFTLTGGAFCGILVPVETNELGRFAFKAPLVYQHNNFVGKAPVIRWTHVPTIRLDNDGNLMAGAFNFPHKTQTDHSGQTLDRF